MMVIWKALLQVLFNRQYFVFYIVEIGFNEVQYRVMEDAQFVTFEVYNRNPDREGEYRVQFTTTDGSAIQRTKEGL